MTRTYKNTISKADERLERLGIVSYTNVAPLHWGLEPWPGASFVRGVPTELNPATPNR